MKSFSLISVLSLIVAFLPASVQAKPVAVDTSCTTGNATVVDASGVSVGFSSCIGRISGNDAARGGALMLGMLNDDDVFGDLDWVLPANRIAATSGLMKGKTMAIGGYLLAWHPSADRSWSASNMATASALISLMA